MKTKIPTLQLEIINASPKKVEIGWIEILFKMPTKKYKLEFDIFKNSNGLNIVEFANTRSKNVIKNLGLELNAELETMILEQYEKYCNK